MKLNRSAIRLILLTGLAGALSAAEVEGVLMDKMCSMKAAKDGQKAATMHTRQCAMMPDCEKGGYGVFTADQQISDLRLRRKRAGDCGAEELE